MLNANQMRLPVISRFLMFGSAFLFLFLASTIGAQQLTGANEDDQVTSRLVSQMIEHYHISQGQIDDTISSKMLDKYLEDWDPQKLYFLTSDIEGWNKYRTQLDNLVKEGKVDFAFEVFNKYISRMDERLPAVHKMIDAEYDFTVNEEMVSDPDLIPWAESEEALNERWRKRIKYELLLGKIDGKKPEEVRESIHKKYRNYALLMHQNERADIMEIFLSSMSHCFDPHSSYMSVRTMQDFSINMSLSLEGIGASLQSDDGYTIVREIIPGGAAAKDGRLKKEDKILSVGQEEGPMEDIVNMKLTNVVQKIRGKPGTKVRLHLKSIDGEEKEITLIRQKIELDASAVKGEIINAGDRIGRTAKIGVVRIPSFYRDFTGAQNGKENFRSTAVDVQKVLNDFRAQGVEAVVVDLRYNGGGALSEAIEVSGLFIDKGPVVQIKQPNGKVSAYDDESPGVAWDGPLVVICNRMAASASEIFAGVIKDYNRGLIIGDSTTHGKGTVQNVMPVSSQMFQIFSKKDRGALKLTIQQFYRVNGDSTQNRGVRSDVVLPSILDHRDLGESSLDNALPFDHIPPARFSQTSFINNAAISELTNKSKQRIDADPDFQKLNNDIKRYVSYKERKSVPLNEEALRAELKPKDGTDLAKDEEKLVEELSNSSSEKEIFRKSFYNNEILNVTVDLLGMTKANKTVSR